MATHDALDTRGLPLFGLRKTFISEVAPPQEHTGPAWWFAFHRNRLLVEVVDAVQRDPIVAGELGRVDGRKTFEGVLQMDHHRRVIADRRHRVGDDDLTVRREAVTGGDGDHVRGPLRTRSRGHDDGGSDV